MRRSIPYTRGHLHILDARNAEVNFRCSILKVSTVLYAGMTCVLKWDMPAAGVLIGAAGLAGVVYAWPLYQKVLKKEREKAVRELPESGGNA